MPQYIAYINRKKNHESELTLIDYYKAITLGVIDAPNIDKAFKSGQEIFKSHPDRLLVNVVHIRKAVEVQRKIAEKLK